MASGTKKVGGGTKASAKPAKEKKEKVKRIEYPHSKPLTAVPADWDPAKHKPLKKKDFEKSYLFVEWTGKEMKRRAELQLKKAEEAIAKADRLSKIGDDKTAKAVKRAERLTKELSKLEETLKAAGIDLESLNTESD